VHEQRLCKIIDLDFNGGIFLERSVDFWLMFTIFLMKIAHDLRRFLYLYFMRIL
jgi:hypothetical protein